MTMRIVVLCLVIFLVASVSGVRLYSPDEMVNNPFNSCNYYAQTTSLVQSISDQCKQMLGKAPNSVEANDDTYPYKLCVLAGNASFSSIQPVDSQSVVAIDSFNNTINQNVSHTFSLTGNYKDVCEISTVNTVSFSESVGFSVDVPIYFQMKFDLNTTFTSSKATTQSSSNTETYESSTNVECAPNCLYTASLNVQSQLYKATFDVPICLTGYAKCSYSSRINGHYWWYDFITADSRCINQNGVLGSAVSVNATTSLSKISILCVSSGLAQTTYPLVCTGLSNNSRAYPISWYYNYGANSAVTYSFKRGTMSFSAYQNAGGMPEATCTWLDRGIGSAEPQKLIFNIPTNVAGNNQCTAFEAGKGFTCTAVNLVSKALFSMADVGGGSVRKTFNAYNSGNGFFIITSLATTQV